MHCRISVRAVSATGQNRKVQSEHIEPALLPEAVVRADMPGGRFVPKPAVSSRGTPRVRKAELLLSHRRAIRVGGTARPSILADPAQRDSTSARL